MKYSELIEKLGKVVENSKLLLRVDGDIICIDAKYFNEGTINKIQRILQLYGECEWCIKESDLVQGVMYKIRIFQTR